MKYRSKRNKKLRRKSKRLMGGNNIGAGTYGCVYQPALLCKGETEANRRHDHISKVLKDANDPEIAILERIDKIDTEGRYHIPIVHKCETSPDLIDPLLDSSEPECGWVDVKSRTQIIQPYGGQSLLEYPITEDNIVELFDAFANILDAVKFFRDAGIVHRDIKPANILYDGVRMRLIDFGLTLFIDDVKSNIDYRDVDNTFVIPIPTVYYAYPPDVAFISHHMSERYLSSRDFQDMIEEFHHVRDMEILSFGRSNGNLSDYMSIIPDKTYYNVLKTGARIIIGSRLGNAEEYITDCLRGLDTYSVGFALLILCLQIGSVTNYERRYRAIANRMRDLIGNMMRPLWWERLDIADAIDDYRDIVKDLRDEYLSGLIATTSIK